MPPGGVKEDVFGGGIMLELAEMVEDDPLNAEAGGVISEDKGDPIMFLGGRRWCEGTQPLRGRGQCARQQQHYPCQRV